MLFFFWRAGRGKPEVPEKNPRCRARIIAKATHLTEQSLEVLISLDFYKREVRMKTIHKMSR